MFNFIEIQLPVLYVLKSFVEHPLKVVFYSTEYLKNYKTKVLLTIARE